MDEYLLNTAQRVFGTSEGSIDWPYGLSVTVARTTTPEKREQFAARARRTRAGQRAITEWADAYDLRVSKSGCCPLWLSRTTSRNCRNSGLIREMLPDTTLPKSLRRVTTPAYVRCQTFHLKNWFDHVITWNLNRVPVALTATPYQIYEDDLEHLENLLRDDERLAMATSMGNTWYGHGAKQILLWRTDRIRQMHIPDVPDAER